MTEEIAAFRKTALAALAVLAAGFSGSAAADDCQREGLFKNRPQAGGESPPVARYVSDGGQVFVLDRSQGRPLLKFEGSFEVWALQPQPAPRGDVIYKNDLGEPVLRATRLGGVTLFTDDRPQGVAAALVGGGPTLRLAPIGPHALGESLLQASVRATRAARHLIEFDVPNYTPAASALIADAATVTSLAFGRIAQSRDGRQVLDRFRKVELVEGRRPAATVGGEVLRITVTPAQGLAGRPSSERIVKVAMGR